MDGKMTTFKLILGLLYSLIAAFVAPILDFLIFTFVLTICDFATGVRAAKNRKEKITSRGFARTVEKLFFYILAILLSEGMNVVFVQDVSTEFSFTWIVAGFISLTELKSNLENISAITGVDIWKQVAEYLPEIRILKKKNKNQ